MSHFCRVKMKANLLLYSQHQSRVLKMIIRKLRIQRGWSQEQLAELTDVSVRTIQRVEQGHKPGLETAKALATIFEVDVALITNGDNKMNIENNLKQDEAEAILYVKGIKEFQTHLAFYLFSVVTILFASLYSGASMNPGLIGWQPGTILTWTFIGWGIGLLIHGLTVYEVINLFNSNWEKRKIEKRLGRKL